jgi:hypothetical protein
MSTEQTIYPVQVAANRNAPLGSEAICLYGTNGATDLTLIQMVQSVCIRAAAAYEAESVLKMNTMNSGSTLLDTAASWLSQIADGSANWTECKNFLVNEMEIDENSLPDNLNSYDKRMQAADALKNKMDNLTTQQQQDMIDLETLVNRRDVAYSTGSNTVRTWGTSVSKDAANFT